MSTRSRLPADRGLVARMGFTMFLLGALYVGLVVGLYSAGLHLGFVIVIAAVLLFSQYYFSDKAALYAMGGKVVTPEQAPELHGIIDRLCALSDAPKPKVAVADIDMPNAFATGRNPSHAVVCVTTGIMRRLEPEELEGVLAHEMSHVAHRDVAVMTIASGVGMLAGIITRMAVWFGPMLGGGRSDDEEGGAFGFLISLVVSLVVYAISFLLIRALSRYRELSADRSGAILTGRPSALASALVKVTGDMARIPTRDLRAAEPYNAFFFTPALSNGVSISSLFSTHPSLDKRLAQLAQLSQQLGQPVA